MAYLALLILGGIFALGHPAIGVDHGVVVGAAAAWFVFAVWGLWMIHRPSGFDI